MSSFPTYQNGISISMSNMNGLPVAHRRPLPPPGPLYPGPPSCGGLKYEHLWFCLRSLYASEHPMISEKDLGEVKPRCYKVARSPVGHGPWCGSWQGSVQPQNARRTALWRTARLQGRPRVIWWPTQAGRDRRQAAGRPQGAQGPEAFGHKSTHRGGGRQSSLEPRSAAIAEERVFMDYLFVTKPNSGFRHK